MLFCYLDNVVFLVGKSRIQGIGFDLTLFSKINTCITNNDVTMTYIIYDYAKYNTRKQYLLISIVVLS